MSVITDLIDENSECHRRIAELEAVLYAERIDADGQRREFDAATQNIAGLRAELAALKVQEPVAWVHFHNGEVAYDRSYVISNEHGDSLDETYEWRPVYSAPVVSAEPAGEVPEVLLTALRQYRHNYGDNELIAGYDYDETNRIVAALQARAVVMPERWNVPRPMWKDARQPFGNPLNHADIEAAEKFNLALDEVARLNSEVGV